ncbi:protein of unknown function [Candidatus Filomicrobium marinum]|uniref:Uncharacterized protein n=1 Tax=Candidatus Filomicrobium marinum TaxID=1608628 RepID=A0A0D6JAW0_9HYPH|nr:protein of unknown function [Candidatus Filomicrobium marinum]
MAFGDGMFRSTADHWFEGRGQPDDTASAV